MDLFQGDNVSPIEVLQTSQTFKTWREERLLVNPHNVRLFYTRQQTRVLLLLKVEGVEYIMRGKVVEVTLIEIIIFFFNSTFPCIVEM